jgi:dTDP-4-amino-4,6-dideoxygalactose transaminase
LLDGSQAVLTTSGRSAIALALDQLNISTGDEVLLPAYHCAAMRAPIEACGAVPVFYRLDRNLDIDLADLEARLTKRSRCVMTVHFFGFPQDHVSVRRLCDTYGLKLIEDCAHAFYGPAESHVGRSGDFAVGSLMKFFPVFDGGCLISFRHAFERPTLSSRGLLFQLKALVNILELAATWGDSRVTRWVATFFSRAVTVAKALRPGLTRELADSSPAAAQGSLGFQKDWVYARMSAPSRLVLRLANHGQSIARRRSIYAQYASGLAAVSGGHPLRSDLPEGVVPYVFPFVLDMPERSFQALRAAGVPIYRWEDVEESCATARHYKTRLVQFPCHQSLEEREVVELIHTIREVLETSSIPEPPRLASAIAQ